VLCVSAHGREHNAPGEVQRHRRTFVLTGGNYRAEDFARELIERGMGDVKLTVGEKISYPDERIVSGTAAQIANQSFESLAVVFAENPHPIERPYSAPYLADADFERTKTPMTKEEVRAVSISKLRIAPEHTVWDVGAGTGSVSVEAAFAASAGRVFAVERNEEATELIERNCEKFGLTNVVVVRGKAPEALETLPAPDRVFIGGSAGNMESIMRLCLEKNPDVRFVVNAVTLETLSETARCFALLGIEDTDMVQLSCTRTRNVGSYHMMDAQNPVWVMSGEARRG
jgi:precorrin-6Y C5,15-methyltransferase (decarboxylating)